MTNYAEQIADLQRRVSELDALLRQRDRIIWRLVKSQRSRIVVPAEVANAAPRRPKWSFTKGRRGEWIVTA